MAKKTIGLALVGAGCLVAVLMVQRALLRRETLERHFLCRLHLALPEGQDTVLVPSMSLPVTFTAKGGRKALMEFDRWLRFHGNALRCELLGFAVGDHQPATVEILSKAPRITGLGLEVKSATPARCEFSIEDLVRRSLPVVFDYSGGELENDPEIEPSAVQVSAPGSAWKRIDEVQPTPVVKTVRRDLTAFTKGQPTIEICKLVPRIADVPVDLTAQEVMVTFVPQPKTATVTVDVKVLVPAPWLMEEERAEHALLQKDPAQWRPTITLVGEDLGNLAKGDVQAYVELTEQDKRPVESWLERMVQVRLWAGSQLGFVGEAPTVQFKLIKLGEQTEP